MNSDLLIDGFLNDLKIAISEFKKEIQWVGRVGVPGVMAGRDAAGEYHRSGSLGSLGSFKFHGFGCLFEFSDGRTVDVNFGDKSLLVFDIWRLKQYAASLGDMKFTDKELRNSCERLVELGLLDHAREGSFSINLHWM